MKFTIYVSKKLLEIAKIICKKVKREWYAFPLGKYECGKDECKFYFLELYVPNQYAAFSHVDIPAEATAKALDKIEGYIKENKEFVMLGMWHSHGDFAVFHSAEDLANIERVYSTFIRLLPTHYISETPISFALSDIMTIDPLFDDGFKGIRIDAGTVILEFDFRRSIKDKKFFAKWYTYFAQLKILFEVLKEVYDVEPIVKGIIKNKAHFVVSVVINNSGDIDGRVFVYEFSQKGIKKYSKKAEISIVDLGEPKIVSKNNIETIVSRIW